MVIVLVGLEVVGEAVDALGKQRDLDLGRAGVALVHLELLDEALLLVRGQPHADSSRRLPPPPPRPPGRPPPNRHVPRAPTAAPLGRVRWTTQIRVRTERSVTRGSEPFNRSPRGWCVGLPAQPPPGLSHVGLDLRLESVHARELHLGSDPPEEIERQG